MLCFLKTLPLEVNCASDELEREHQRVATPPGGGETATPLAGDSLGRGAVHGLRTGAGGSAIPPRDTRPDRATRFIEVRVKTAQVRIDVTDWHTLNG